MSLLSTLYVGVSGGGGGGGINNVHEDTTPQLGGNLDVNSFAIVSIANGDIPITPNGSGSIILDGLNWPQADGTADQVLKTDGAGQLSWTDNTGGGLNDVVDDTTPQLGGNLDVNGNSIVSTAAGNIVITPDTTGNIVLDGLNWPQADGTANQVLETNGSGQLAWVDQVDTGILNVVEDTTPQLGGNLDVNGNDIVSTAAGDITITPDTTGNIVLDGLNWPQADGTANQVLETNGSGQLAWVDQVDTGILNVVEDTTPQLGGNLDTNSFNITIDDAHGIIDENGNEQLIFSTTSDAVNYVTIKNSATGFQPTITSTGDDANIDLELNAKGTGVVRIGAGRILTTEDEGAGNGLDADTVDGNHASAFALASHTHTESDITDLGSYIENVVEDTTPQLGGNLDVNGNDIVSTAAGDITITPDTTGNIVLDGLNWPQADGTANQVLETNGSGQLAWVDQVDTGILNVVEDTTPQLGGDLDVNGNSIVSTAAGNIAITPDTTGDIILDGLNWPQADGIADQVLKTDGAGQLSWTTVATGGLGNVVEDTTPQLGGDLDTNSFNITIDDAHGIYDENGNEQLRFNTTSSAVNFMSIKNSATGFHPVLSVGGDDTNIDFELKAKGTGVVRIGSFRILTAGDEGAGNGLDADTVDGLEAAAFALASHTHTESDITDLGSYIENVVEDTTPQLGGNLDVNGNDIVSTAAGDITITPDTTGNIVLDGLNWPQADGTANQVLETNGSGQLAWVDQVDTGILNVVEDTTPQLGGNLDVNGNDIVSTAAGDITITPDTTGNIVLDGLNWPQADGTADQFLQTDGAGQLVFASMPTDPVLTLDVRNDSVGTLTKGRPVYISGWNASGYAEIAISDADNANTMPTLTIIDQDVDDTTTVSIQVTGILTNMVTNSLTEGAPIYTSDGGLMTSTRPTDPADEVQAIGYCIRSHATEGIIQLSNTIESVDIPNRMSDAIVRIVDDGDATKVAMFQASGITTATTRTFTFPDASGIIELEGHTHTESDITDLGSYLENVVEDTTPQLGGNLDVNGNSIVSVTNGDIVITPDGSGNIDLNGLIWPTADGTANQVIETDGAGNLSFVDAGGGLADVVDDTTPQLGGDLDVNGFSIVSATAGNIEITPDTTGDLVLDGLNWPQADGTNGQSLTTNGAGQLAWTTVGGMADLIDDTTPQLGGDLDVNGNSIVSNTGGNIDIQPDGAGMIILSGLNWPTADGNANEYLQTDGAGNLSWATAGGMADLIDDTTPQLGGDLDVNGFEINSTAGNVTLSPAGDLDLNGLIWPTADGTANQVIETDGAGNLSFADPGIANVVDDTTPQLGGNLDVNGNSIVSVSNGDIAITPNGSGDIVLDGQNWPQADGTNGQVLSTNGSGQLSWVAAGGGGGGSATEESLTNETGGTIDIGEAVYSSAAGECALARANAIGTSQVIGLAKADITDTNSGDIVTAGKITATTGEWDAVTGDTGGLTFNTVYYLDPDTAGKLTSTAPTTAGQTVVRVGVATSTTTMVIRIEEPIEL